MSFGLNTMAQVAINTDGSPPDESAILDAKSSNKGFLPPRMTAEEIGFIENPASGLMVFNTDDDKIYIFVSTNNEWKELNYGVGTITPPWLCGNVLIDSRDVQSYTTVQIGTQCWMAENLNIGTIQNGSNNQTNNSTIEKYCYDNSTSNCDVYGGLYQWDEMMQYVASGAGIQGVCPNEWHIPTDDEWTTLTDYLDGISIAGIKLKEVGTTHWWSPNTATTNISGFTALPGGDRNRISGSFDFLRFHGYWWSSTESSSTAAVFRSMHYDTYQVTVGNLIKQYGISVRCLRN